MFVTANTAALAAGVEPTENWSLAAPLWVAATLMQTLFFSASLELARLAAFLVGLAMSGWIFVMSIQVALTVSGIS